MGTALGATSALALFIRAAFVVKAALAVAATLLSAGCHVYVL